MRLTRGFRLLLQTSFLILCFQMLLVLNRQFLNNGVDDIATNDLNVSSNVPVSQVKVEVTVSPSEEQKLLYKSSGVLQNLTKLSDIKNHLIPKTMQQNIKVVGKPRDVTGFLTIGIPSIKRSIGPVYLMNTLQSIVDQTSQLDRLRTVVLIFLGDEDTAYNEDVLKQIVSRFKLYIDMGFFQIIQADKRLYPNLDIHKRNYGDTLDRVRWRSKQVADFSLMFKYSENISTYYLQIEDDILCAPQFVQIIENFIREKSTRSWTILEFTNIGFIGKLFKSQDLNKLAIFMLTFYQEQPVDWLIDYFRLTMTQKDKLIRKPALFQHMGKKSSFAGNKDKKVAAPMFKPPAQAHISNNNPVAIILSQMKSYQANVPENAYLYSNAFFWAVDVTKGDSLNIVFEKELLLSKVLVKTGTVEKPNDVLRIGSVYVSHAVEKMNIENFDVKCVDPIKIGSIQNGKFEMEKLEQKISTQTKCLIITIDADQKDWIIFDNILVTPAK